VTESEIIIFLDVILQMEHDMQDGLTNYWATMEHFYTPFYSLTNDIKADVL
jgi:hypothetical protein